MTALVLLFACLAAAGAAIAVLGAMAVRAFVRHRPGPLNAMPPVTILKPLCGAEPLLETALSTFCVQSYADIQIVFGVQDAADPALATVAALRTRFPELDISVVVDGRVHGPNRKISNLMNMLPLARHDLLILADSDLHVPPEYVGRVVEALRRPGVGLVTTLCTGLPTTPGLVARLGATGITHSFLPGALLSRALGRQDCLGTTMGVRRATLERVGGLEALVAHVADDHVFAERVCDAGLGTAFAAVVAKTAVPEASLRALHQHELRWARTIRGVEPVLFATSALQYPLFWALLAVAASGGAGWTLALFGGAWCVRTVAALAVDRSLGLGGTRQAFPVLLSPVRDVLSGWLVVASYLGSQVVWRGQVMQVRAGWRVPAAERAGGNEAATGL